MFEALHTLNLLYNYLFATPGTPKMLTYNPPVGYLQCNGCWILVLSCSCCHQ